MNTIEVCLTPDLIHQHQLEGKIVVVADIFRATSCIVSGIANKVASITPVATLDECKSLQKKGYIAAAERGGQKVDGFDIGNSPFSYLNEYMTNKRVAVTTTNGTLAISKSREADEVIIGAFLNLSAVVKYLTRQKKDVVVHCAGWKGTANVEDTAFAGALIARLDESHNTTGDSALLALALYENYRNDLYVNLLHSSHAKRLSSFGIEKDLEFCCKIDQYDVVPALRNAELVLID